MASALAYLKTKNILHNDIKPANILYDRDRGPILVDFGLATDNISTHSGGSPWYLPPEFLNERKRGHKSDVFALAVSALYLSKRLPLPEVTERERRWDIDAVHERSSPKIMKVAVNAMQRWLRKIDKIRRSLNGETDIAVKSALAFLPQKRVSASQLESLVAVTCSHCETGRGPSTTQGRLDASIDVTVNEKFGSAESQPANPREPTSFGISKVFKSELWDHIGISCITAAPCKPSELGVACPGTIVPTSTLWRFFDKENLPQDQQPAEESLLFAREYNEGLWSGCSAGASSGTILGGLSHGIPEARGQVELMLPATLANCQLPVIPIHRCGAYPPSAFLLQDVRGDNEVHPPLILQQKTEEDIVDGSGVSQNGNFKTGDAEIDFDNLNNLVASLLGEGVLNRLPWDISHLQKVPEVQTIPHELEQTTRCNSDGCATHLLQIPMCTSQQAAGPVDKMSPADISRDVRYRRTKALAKMPADRLESGEVRGTTVTIKRGALGLAWNLTQLLRATAIDDTDKKRLRLKLLAHGLAAQSTEISLPRDLWWTPFNSGVHIVRHFKLETMLHRLIELGGRALPNPLANILNYPVGNKFSVFIIENKLLAYRLCDDFLNLNHLLRLVGQEVRSKVLNRLGDVPYTHIKDAPAHYRGKYIPHTAVREMYRAVGIAETRATTIDALIQETRLDENI